MFVGPELRARKRDHYGENGIGFRQRKPRENIGDLSAADQQGKALDPGVYEAAPGPRVCVGNFAEWMNRVLPAKKADSSSKAGTLGRVLDPLLPVGADSEAVQKS